MPGGNIRPPVPWVARTGGSGTHPDAGANRRPFPQPRDSAIGRRGSRGERTSSEMVRFVCHALPDGTQDFSEVPRRFSSLHSRGDAFGVEADAVTSEEAVFTPRGCPVWVWDGLGVQHIRHRPQSLLSSEVPLHSGDSLDGRGLPKAVRGGEKQISKIHRFTAKMLRSSSAHSTDRSIVTLSLHTADTGPHGSVPSGLCRPVRPWPPPTRCWWRRPCRPSSRLRGS